MKYIPYMEAIIIWHVEESWPVVQGKGGDMLAYLDWN